MAEEWLTQDEAAERLHVALDTMRRYVREGLFPHTRVGKRNLIPASSLEKFLQERLQHGPRPVTPRKKSEPSDENPNSAKQDLVAANP